MTAQRYLICAIVMAAALPACASLCTNPCTGSVVSGSDSTDRTNFHSDNPDLTFNNIIFDDATGTYTAAGGLSAATAPGALLFNVGFVGCFSSQAPCASNSTGLLVGNVTSWGGGTNPAMQLNSGTIGGNNYETFTVAFPSNVYAFGVDILDQNGSSLGVAFLLNVDGKPANSTAAAVSLPGSVYFGYRSATPIGSVSFYAGTNSQRMAFDNFEIGSQEPATTSEAATLVLVGTGLLTLGYARRRKGLTPRAA
jgi:hypothetical protein